MSLTKHKALFYIFLLLPAGGLLLGITLMIVPSHPARASITDSSSAIDALGQYDIANAVDTITPSYTKNGFNSRPNRYGFNFDVNVTSSVLVDTVDHRFFVSDSGYNRVLIFNLNTDNTFPDYYADYVLGQTDFASSTAATTQAGMRSPTSLAYDSAGDRLFVADTLSRRVLVFNLSTITNGESAVNVLGKADFISNTGTTTQAGMKAPFGLAYDASGQRLFVSEWDNNRVLVFDVATIADGELATNVLGQANFTAGSSAVTQTGMNLAAQLAFDSASNRLYVAEEFNRRVMVFDVATVTDGEAAIYVIGQANFTSSSFATTQTGLGTATGVALSGSGTTLYIADSFRVMVYDLSATTTTGMAAAHVLGQAIFTTNSGATTQAGLQVARELTLDTTSNLLYVPQEGAHRISVFDVASVTDNEPAVSMIGQYDHYGTTPPALTLTYTSGVRDGGTPLITLSGVHGALVDDIKHRLYIPDEFNNRILVHTLNTDNSLVDAIPDNWLSVSTTVAQTLSSPSALAVDATGDRLFVADTSKNRVMVYDVATITNSENAVNVLGQVNFTGTSSATTQTGLNQPQGLTFSTTGNRLFVADTGNNRVMVYDVTSITDGEAAVNVVGQTIFTSASTGLTQSKLNTPRHLAYDLTGNRLFVADSSNRRVTVYDAATTTDGLDASSVLGQIDFTSNTAAATQTGMNTPRGVAFDATNNRLFVGDTSNNRVTVYDVAAITDGEAAVNLFGQANYTSSSAATTQAGLNSPRGLAYAPGSGRLYVADYTNNRIIVYDAAVAVAPSSGGGGHSQPPTVAVVIPNGGETLNGSSTQQVVWSSGGTGISTYTLHYSVDGGATWTLIASGIVNAYTNWTVPNGVNTTTAKLMIEALDVAGTVVASDQSDGTFTLVSTIQPEPAPTHIYNYDPAKETADAASIDAAMGLVAVANPLCVPGALLRGTRAAVYYCGVDGKRYVFHNAKVFATWFPDFSSVQFVTNAELSAIPLAPGFVQYRPGVRMVKLQTNPKVYAVTKNGILRLVPDEATAAALYGSDWNTKIDDIAPAFFSGYVIGQPIN